MARVSAAEREAKAREEIAEAIEHVLPNVIGNPFIPHWPTPPQARFLGIHLEADTSRVFEALYGGSAGGGKSDALLMAAAQYAWKHPEFSGIMFRRTHTDLAQPGALLDRAREWWVPAGVHWDGTNKIFTFPSGAKVAMAYLKNPSDHLRYQGAEYQYTAWDELTQWPTEAPYQYVGLSRVRRPSDSNIPLRTLSASNPGGPGHVWVKNMFIGGVDPETGLEIEPMHPYIPARIDDNPHIDREAYIAGLMHLHPTVREQLLNGDWSAREPGDYFRAEWFGPLLDPAEDKWAPKSCRRIRWWDLAASEKKEACRTAGVLMARHTRGCRAIEHAVAFRATPGSRDDKIIQQAELDGRHVVVGIEIEGGSGGIAQYEALKKRLTAKGFKVDGARPGTQNTDREKAYVVRNPSSDNAKAARADPVAACLERGYMERGNYESHHYERTGIRLFSGTWTQDYLDEVEGFPEAAFCDLVDATSGAWAWLEAHPAGVSLPPTIEKVSPVGEQHDLHPSERADRMRSQKTRGGQWRM